MCEALKQLGLIALGVTPYWLGAVMHERKQLGLNYYDGIKSLIVPPADPMYPETVAAVYTRSHASPSLGHSATLIPNGDRCQKPLFKLREDGVPVYVGCGDPGGIIYQKPYPTIHELVTTPSALSIAEKPEMLEEPDPEPELKPKKIQNVQEVMLGHVYLLVLTILLLLILFVGLSIILAGMLSSAITSHKSHFSGIRQLRRDMQDKDVEINRLRGKEVAAQNLVLLADGLFRNVQEKNAQIASLGKDLDSAKDVLALAERLYHLVEDKDVEIDELKREVAAAERLRVHRNPTNDHASQTDECKVNIKDNAGHIDYDRIETKDIACQTNNGSCQTKNNGTQTNNDGHQAIDSKGRPEKDGDPEPNIPKPSPTPLPAKPTAAFTTNKNHSPAHSPQPTPTPTSSSSSGVFPRPSIPIPARLQTQPISSKTPSTGLPRRAWDIPTTSSGANNAAAASFARHMQNTKPSLPAKPSQPSSPANSNTNTPAEASKKPEETPKSDSESEDSDTPTPDTWAGAGAQGVTPQQAGGKKKKTRRKERSHRDKKGKNADGGNSNGGSGGNGEGSSNGTQGART